ncbi:uncharacterized protein [Panulirus ornatus]|uniref:uncharacterized protein n=1 Tax=Panulirus ornatus TaxID=150431 RepID=UPI003A8B54FB
MKWSPALVVCLVASCGASLLDVLKSWKDDLVHAGNAWGHSGMPWAAASPHTWSQTRPIHVKIPTLKPIVVPYPKLESLPVVKTFPVLKPEFVDVFVPVHRPDQQAPFYGHDGVKQLQVKDQQDQVSQDHQHLQLQQQLYLKLQQRLQNQRKRQF